MIDYNSVTVLGRLTTDPELKYVPNGSAVCKLRLASNRKWKNAAGEQKEDVLFIGATCWAAQAEWAAANLRKGNPVFVAGRLQFHQWEKDGVKRSSIEIQVQHLTSLAAKTAAQTGDVASSEDVPF